MALLLVLAASWAEENHTEPLHHLIASKFDTNKDGFLDHEEVGALWKAMGLPEVHHNDTHGHKDGHDHAHGHADGHGGHASGHSNDTHTDEHGHNDTHTPGHTDEHKHEEHERGEGCLANPDAVLRYVRDGAEHQNNASMDVESFKVAVGSEEVNLTEPIHKLLGRLVLELVTEGCNGSTAHAHDEDGHKEEHHDEHKEEHGHNETHGEEHEHEHHDEEPWEVLLERFDMNKNKHLEYYEIERVWMAMGFKGTAKAEAESGHEGHAHGRRVGHVLAQEEEKCKGLEGVTKLAAFGDEHVGDHVTASLNLTQIPLLMEGMLLEKVTAGCTAETTKPSDDCSGPSTDKVWGYSMLAVLLLSVFAAVVVVLVPLFTVHSCVMEFLLSLAVGALLGDTFYHLLPILLGRHHVGGGHGDDITQWDIRTRLTTALLTILAFYWIDYLTRFMLGGHTAHEESDTSETNERCPDLESASKAVQKETKKKPKWNEWVPLRQVKTLAWVCVISDGFHNFTDGLAIGASFHKSTSLGVATSTAIAFHEIPQEIGDFALLLKAGMSPIQAVLFNFVSAALSMLGAVISCAIGGSEDAENYILSVTAGSFIYMAIGVVAPELLEMKKSARKNWLRLGVHTLGMTLGGLIMWIIAHTEDEHKCEHA